MQAYKSFYVRTFEKCTCCIDRNVWLSANHIPGKGNITTNYQMRTLNLSYSSTIFKKPPTHFTSKTHY